MPLEELLARYGYGVPAEGNEEEEEGEEEEEEEREDEEQDTKEPPPQTGQTSSQAGQSSQTSSQVGQTSQTSSNPSQTRSQQSPHPARPDDQAVVKDSPPHSPHSPLDLLAHETAEDLELSEGEEGGEEREGEMARSPSPADAADSLSVLGKHPRSDDDHSHSPVHKDILLSSSATDRGTCTVPRLYKARHLHLLYIHCTCM